MKKFFWSLGLILVIPYSILKAQCDLTISVSNPSEACFVAVKDVVWTNEINVSESYNSIVKINGGNGDWNAGASSVNKVDTFGYFEFTASETNLDRMAGLSSVDTDANFNTIEYAWFLRSNGSLRIYESGTLRGDFGTYSNGDKFRILALDSEIRFYQNGILVFIIYDNPAFPLIADVSINDLGGTITDAKTANGFDGLFFAETGGVGPGISPTYQWKLNGVNVGSNDSTYTNTALNIGDSIQVILSPGVGACNTVNDTSNFVVIDSIFSLKEISEFYIQPRNQIPSCLNADIRIVWTDVENLEANGNNLTKIQGGNGNWNAGAASLNSLNNGGEFFFIADELNLDRMIGLSSANVNADFNSIEYAWFLRSNGTLRIYESGNFIGDFGAYNTGDTFSIRINKNKVYYYQNGILDYISGSIPATPLIADVSINDEGGTVKGAFFRVPTSGNFDGFHTNAGTNPNFQWYLNGISVGLDTTFYSEDSLKSGDIVYCDITPDLPFCSGKTYRSDTVFLMKQNIPNLDTFFIFNFASTNACQEAVEFVTWNNEINTEASGNNLSKLQGGNGNWNAGASSLNNVTNNGYLQFEASETNLDRMIGLSETDQDANFTTIEYAWFLRSNGTLRIYESGNFIGDFGSYTSGDTFQIRMENFEIKYYRNGVLAYVSQTPPAIPLIVDVSINDLGGSVTNAQVVNGNTGIFMVMNSDAGPDPVYQWFLNDLKVGADSNLYINSNLSNGDSIYCIIYPDLNGCRTSFDSIAYISQPIVLLNIPNARFGTFYTTHNGVASACKELVEEITWTDVVNAEASKNDLNKLQGGSGNWNAGAASLNSVTNNGRLQFEALETNRDRMIGLSDINIDANFNTIDFCWFLRSNGTLRIYENGNFRGDFGLYNTGDEFSIRVENNVVKYYQNGTLSYISQDTPNLPLIADVSIQDEGGTVRNALVVNGNTGELVTIAENAGNSPVYEWFINGISIGNNDSLYTNTSLNANDTITCRIIPDLGGCSSTNSYITNPVFLQDIQDATFGTFYTKNESSSFSCQEAVELITWVDLENLEDNANSLNKIQGGNGNWNGGAASLNQVFDNGRLEFIAVETNTDRMVGLSDVNINSNFNTIDYCWFLRNNGTLRIFENGSLRGDFGSYLSGDTFSIKVEAGIVKYYRNSSLSYISNIAPSLPLLADVSIQDQGGTVENAVIINGNTGIFRTIAENSGNSPTYSWFLNGVSVGNNDSTYINLSLNDGDTIFCTVLPGLGGCSPSNTYSTEPVIIRNLSEINYGEFGIINRVNPPGSLNAWEEVSWTNITNLEDAGNSLEKIQGGNGNWNAGAGTINKITNNSLIQTIVAETNRDRIFGLDGTNPNDNFNSIDYGMWLRNNGTLRIYENGVFRGDFGAYTTGDTLKVAFINGQIQYYRNQTQLYTSAIVPLDTLIGDFSVQDQGGTFNDVFVVHYASDTFFANVTGLGPDPGFQWQLNGVNVGSDTSVYVNNSLTAGDIITLFIRPDFDGCTNANPFITNRIIITEKIQPLPLEIHSFTLYTILRDVHLSWQVNNEEGVSNYIIERSESGLNFKAIAELNKQSVFNENSIYSYIDSNLPDGTFYYRIVQMNVDGSKEYTKILATAFINSTEDGVFIYPNPTTGTIRIIGIKEDIREVKLISPEGKVYNSNGFTKDKIELNEKLEGLYILSIRTDKSTYRKKVIIK